MCKDPLHLIYTKMNPTNSALESPSSPQNKQLGLFFFFFCPSEPEQVFCFERPKQFLSAE